MRRTKEEAEQTRQHILEAAIKVMNERGIGATRFEDIAIEANVTRGAIYYYFKSKNDIIYAIHSDMKRQMIDLFEKHTNEGIDPAVSIKRGFKEVLRRFKEDSNYRAIEELFMKAEFASLMKKDKDLNSLFEKEREETVCDMLELVKRGQETGSIRKDIIPNNLGFSIIAFYVGFITTAFIGSGKLAEKGIIDDYIDILLNGILK